LCLPSVEKMTQTFIALLRGINVSGRNKILMADLRSLCAELGWQDVQSYIQSGNLLFGAEATAADLESELEQAIERAFGLSIPVIVRETAVWSTYVNNNPYPQASQAEPNRVMLALSKLPPKEDAVTSLQPYAADNERIKQVGDALWIHYSSGSGRSKLSPAVLDRLVGSPVTTRNWRTVLKLEELTQSYQNDTLANEQE
jgi:uncharacterized protein (DUF1697 family)